MEKPQPWLFLQSTFPQTSADIIAHLLFVSVIHMRQQVKHEMKSHKTHTGYIVDWMKVRKDMLKVYGTKG